MCEYRKTVLTRIEKWYNRCEYRRVIISGGVSGKSGIRASTGKLSWRVPKMVESVWVPENYVIRASTGKKWNMCEYRKTVLTSNEKWYNRCEYRKVIESGGVSGKSGIRASIGKLSWRVPKNGRIGVSTGKLLNPGQYREKVKSVRVPENCPDEYRKMI